MKRSGYISRYKMYPSIYLITNGYTLSFKAPKDRINISSKALYLDRSEAALLEVQTSIRPLSAEQNILDFRNFKARIMASL